MDRNLCPFVAELIGTFALVFISAGTVCAAQVPILPPAQQPGLVSIGLPGLAGIALAQGFVYAAFLSATVNISGGYLNPAITLTLWVFKRLETAKAMGFVGAQLLGAALAGVLLRVSFKEEVLNVAHLGTPHLTEAFFRERVTWEATLSGIGIEAALTFLLTFVVFGTLLDPRAQRLAGLGAGLALTALVLMGFHLTGAAVNPARWFGTAIWEMTLPTLRPNAFADNLVYLIGPLAGALLAGGIYTLLLLPPEEAKTASAAAPPMGATTGAAGATPIKAKK
jgi:MIP family channel proteins